jgi:urease accessory protein
VSPALPIGAYAYSRGLEYAVAAHWVGDGDTATAWIEGQLTDVLATLDIPVLIRLYRAWHSGDNSLLYYWSRFLLAARDSAELVAEDRDLGRALARLLTDLGLEEARPWQAAEQASFAALFALATERWGIDRREAAEAYAWVSCEHQVAAAVKLIPLGQTAGQRLLLQLADRIPEAVCSGLDLNDNEIRGAAPGLGIASARHEVQYTRLFRS